MTPPSLPPYNHACAPHVSETSRSSFDRVFRWEEGGVENKRGRDAGSGEGRGETEVERNGEAGRLIGALLSALTGKNVLYAAKSRRSQQPAQPSR